MPYINPGIRHIADNITLTSQWPSCRLKSPATRRFIQRFALVNIKEASKLWVAAPSGGEFTDDRWIPRTKHQQRGKSFHLMTSSWKNCDNFTKRYDALSSYVWLESNESSYYIVIIKCNRGVATTQLQTLVKVSIDQAILYLVLAFFRSSEVRITVMSNERHGISAHWQLDHLFNSLFQLTKTYQICALLDHYVWRGQTVICDSPYKGPVMRKPSPCRDVIIL